MSAVESYGKVPKGKGEVGRRNKGKEQPKGAVFSQLLVGVWGLILLGTFGSWGGASSPSISRSALTLPEGCPRC